MTRKDYEEGMKAICEKYGKNMTFKESLEMKIEMDEWLMTYNESLGLVYPFNKCCICGETFKGFGNNPSPVRDGICCDTCNTRIVMPIRIAFRKIEKASAKSGTPIQTNIDKIVAGMLQTMEVEKTKKIS